MSGLFSPLSYHIGGVKMKNNPLDQIMGVKEAAQLWGLSPDHVKRLCRDEKVIARNIGKTWIILKDQPNPKSTK